MKKSFGVVAASLLMLGSAHAQQPTKPLLYGEIGYVALSISGAGESFKPGVIRGIVGYEFHPNLAVEGMLSGGVKDDNINVLGFNVKSEVRRRYGFFIKPKVNLTNELELFGRVGFVNTQLKASTRGFSASDDASTIAYGVGLNYSISPTLYVGTDYTSYYKKNGVKVAGFNVGVGFRF